MAQMRRLSSVMLASAALMVGVGGVMGLEGAGGAGSTGEGLRDGAAGGGGVWSADAVRAELVRGVKEIAAPGVPGPLGVFGPRATVVATGGYRGVEGAVVAVGELGEGKDAGRVVAFGHTGYLDRENIKQRDTGVLLRNVMNWAGRRAEGDTRVMTVGLVDLPGLAAWGGWVKEQGWSVRALKGAEITPEKLKGCAVVMMGQGALSEQAHAAVVGHLKQGGGVVMAGLGWGWLQLNPGKKLNEHPGNRLLREVGIAWADGTLERTTDGGYSVDGALPEGLHGGTGLDLLIAEEARVPGVQKNGKPAKVVGAAARKAKQAAVTVELCAQSAQRDDGYLLPRMEKLLVERGEGLVASKKEPLDWRRGLDRVLMAMQVRRMEGLPPSQVRAHKGAASFPGAVGAGVPRVTKTVSFDASAGGWRGTGLYAAPGQIVRVLVNEPAVKLGLRLQIGCHTDGNWHHDSWERCPDVVVSRAINERTCELASAYGGPIYVVMPGTGAVETGPITIDGGVEAPRYVLGETSDEEWARQRGLPGPWAELESGKVILTVPSETIRGLEYPARLMGWWNKVSDAHADLATIERARKRPERYVADVQISAGYMHSGYPIMTHLDAAAHMTNAADLERGVNAWGLLHELGHNHQSSLWTFEGTGEVTVNLFTMHALEKVCGVPVGGGWWWKEEDRERLIAKHLLKDKGDFGKWKSDPSTALIMYIQLQRAFGWATFEKLFAEYRELKKGEQPKTTEEEKRDQWMVRFSKATEKNLGPFFQAWGVPTSEGARRSVAELPGWMPAGFPPVSDGGKQGEAPK